MLLVKNTFFQSRKGYELQSQRAITRDVSTAMEEPILSSLIQVSTFQSPEACCSMAYKLIKWPRRMESSKRQ